MKQADVIEQEKFLNFKIPAYRYFFVNTYLPVVKFKGMNLWREFYCELTPDGMVNLFIPEKTFLNPGRVLLGLLKKRDADLCEELYKISSKLIEASEYLMDLNYKDQKTGNISDLKKIHPKFFKLFNRSLGFGYVLDSGIDDFIKQDNKISKKVKSPYGSFLAQEEYELYQIFSTVNNRNERLLEERLKEHLFKWSWIKTSYRGESHLTKKELLERKNELLKSKPSKPRLTPKVLKKPKSLAEWISLLIFIRDVRKKMALLLTVILDRYLKLSCQELGVDYNKARFLTIDEFESCKKIKSIPDYTSGRYEYISPQGLSIVKKDKWLKNFSLKKREDSSQKELRGIIANKGIVKGVARVVLSSDDFDNFKRGEIIVASMTRPEFMPIIKKAAAILTEQGGITCHAAIIAREINIPCIIGIKNLLATLKNGDKLEVNADSGTIRIFN